MGLFINFVMQLRGAAVSCSADTVRLGGVGFGFWLTGKLGHAWVSAWVEHGIVCGLVRLDLGVGGGLDGDGMVYTGVIC